uniref:Non-specific serine/threonine protein kinase n=1 Tax=Macrostomum lignano TaxID=282301 RepID=A0A1I8FND2_9PLAT
MPRPSCLKRLSDLASQLAQCGQGLGEFAFDRELLHDQSDYPRSHAPPASASAAIRRSAQRRLKQPAACRPAPDNGIWRAGPAAAGSSSEAAAGVPADADISNIHRCLAGAGSSGGLYSAHINEEVSRAKLRDTMLRMLRRSDIPDCRCRVAAQTGCCWQIELERVRFDRPAYRSQRSFRYTLRLKNMAVLEGMCNMLRDNQTITHQSEAAAACNALGGGEQSRSKRAVTSWLLERVPTVAQRASRRKAWDPLVLQLESFPALPPSLSRLPRACGCWTWRTTRVTGVPADVSGCAKLARAQTSKVNKIARCRRLKKMLETTRCSAPRWCWSTCARRRLHRPGQATAKAAGKKQKKQQPTTASSDSSPRLAMETMLIEAEAATVSTSGDWRPESDLTCRLQASRCWRCGPTWCLCAVRNIGTLASAPGRFKAFLACQQALHDGLADRRQKLTVASHDLDKIRFAPVPSRPGHRPRSCSGRSSRPKRNRAPEVVPPAPSAKAEDERERRREADHGSGVHRYAVPTDPANEAGLAIEQVRTLTGRAASGVYRREPTWSAARPARAGFQPAVDDRSEQKAALHLCGCCEESSFDDEF